MFDRSDIRYMYDKNKIESWRIQSGVSVADAAEALGMYPDGWKQYITNGTERLDSMFIARIPALATLLGCMPLAFVRDEWLD